METETIEEAEDKIKLDSKLIAEIVIFISIGMLLTAGYLIYHEYSTARNSCINSEGEFEFKFPNKYFCNSKPFLKYSDGSWDWEREVNISEWLPHL